ncbi:hypothetical protein [Sphingomonas sp. MMS24-J13]|uniref:hypothetical protein n=1 Tax=Sphingomonas sp. MMS24-J13 TaxID=3238686 RepID=UPI00384F2E0B
MAMFPNPLGRLRDVMRGRGGPPITATATVTMTQLASANRIYQRSSRTGGGQGKGQGSIPLALSAATAAGTIVARFSSGGATRGDYQAPWVAATIAATGAQTVNITGVDAGLRWGYLDILDSTGTWQNGTTLVGMGRITAFGGQSPVTRMIYPLSDASTTCASLGITPNGFTSAYATYDVSSGLPTGWRSPSDSDTVYKSAFIMDFLNRQSAQFGVVCGFAGASIGGSPLCTIQPQLLNVLAQVGGWESLFWYQEYDDAQRSSTKKLYKAALDYLFSQLNALNTAYPSYTKYVGGIHNTGPLSATTFAPAIQGGSIAQRVQMRRASREWATANSALQILPADIKTADGVHQTQAGALACSTHFHRATYAEAGGDASGDVGATIVSATRSGTTVTVNLSQQSGGTALVGTGSWWTRFTLYEVGSVRSAWPITGGAIVNSTQLTLTLGNDPGDGKPLDLWLYIPWETGANVNDGTINVLRDNRTADGFAVGRNVMPTLDPVSIAAPSPGGAQNTPPGGIIPAVSTLALTGTSPTYSASGVSGFGQMMTGGTAILGTGACPMIVAGLTFEAFFVCPALTASTQAIISFSTNSYVAVTSGGLLTVKAGGIVTPVNSASALTPGHRYHVALVVSANGWNVYLTDTTAATAGALVITKTGATSLIQSQQVAGVRTYNGTSNMTGSGGAVSNVALWQVEKYSGASYTAPTAPYTGAETDLIESWLLDGNLNGSVLSA